MSQEQTIKLIKHQSLMVRMPWEYPHIQDHFMIGGYASGKTSGLSYSITDTINKYWKYPIEVGLFSPTLTFMKKTLITQLEKLFIQSGTKYNYNKQENIIKIGNLKLVMIPIDQPKNIYGHNLCISFVDEIDELPQDIAMEAYRAVSERTRIDLPDGKKPFSLFATTAQGYRGTYQIIEELKEAGVGYTHIRGLTKDNIYGVSDEYFQKLWALYDENERMAFLEGRFVNLTAGRVYPGYDEAKCMVEPFDIGDRETVYVGQDLNEGYSKATAWVVRNRILYAIKEWSFKDIGLAAKEIRIAFPTQEIRWYPDSSGRVVMAGYTHEYSEQGIMPQFAAVNPARLERVFVLNKLFYMGRAKVFKTLRELPMALKTRQYDDKGDPEKGKGAKSPDHICFSGDTLIATQRGMVRIDSIASGDLAFTRNGLREIENAWCTGEFETHEYQINGMKVRATDNHPVITMAGKKEISSLTQKDIVFIMTDAEEYACHIKQYERLNTKVSFSEIIQKLTGVMTVFITRLRQRISRKALPIFIEKFGKTRLAKYLQEWLFIIKTATLQITKYQTLNSWNLGNTIPSIQLNGIRIIQEREKKPWTKPEKPQKFGMAAKKAESGIEKPQLDEQGKRSIGHAGNADQNTWAVELPNSVRKNALQSPVENRELITNPEHAEYAVKNFPLVGFPEYKPVLAHVERNSGGRIEKVYNLTVKDDHEYFANGLLVSNCDSADYATHRVISSNTEFADLWELTSTFRRDRK